jgi:endonuclease/exonuclease/phosphatase family metal-dependent hydrolase
MTRFPFRWWTVALCLASPCITLTAGCGAADEQSGDLVDSAYALAAGTYTFGSLAASGKCLDVSEGGSADGTNIQLWTCNGTGAQSFLIKSVGDGKYRLVNRASNKCLDVAGMATADGTNIHLWTCNGSGAQSFSVEESGGVVRFVNTHSNKCVDVARAGTNDGTNVQLWTCNGSNAQGWHAEPASDTPTDTSTEIRVMTFNVRTSDADGSDATIGNDWARRRSLAQAVLSDNDPDVVALEEATSGQVADLRSGFAVLSRPGVVLLYDAGRVDAVDGGSFDVGNYGNSDPWGPRYCNWEKFRLRSNGREFFVYGAHLSTAGDNVPQLRYLLSRADESASAGYPTIVTGDFNFDATTLLRDKSWADAVTDKGGTFHNFHGSRGVRLDFIGLKNLSSVSSGVDTRRDATRSPTVYPSDHYPVRAVLE